MDQEHVLATLRGIVTDVVPGLDPAAVVPEAALLDLGANSVDRADIIADALDAYDLSIPLREFAGRGRVGEIVELICARRTSG